MASAVIAGPISRSVAALVAAGLLASSTTSFADGRSALRAIDAGDCKRAGEEINDGIEHDDALAYLVAGTLYDGTDCVDTDYRRAARYYQRAIELGNDEARNFLGLMYGLGRGVDQDYRTAYRWFTGGRSKTSSETAASSATSDAADSWRAEVAGYAFTVNQLARSKVRYPNASTGEGTVYVTLHSQSGQVSFARHGHGAPGEPLPHSSAFTNAITDAYADAVQVAPRTEAVEQHDLVFETPWTFQRR